MCNHFSKNYIYVKIWLIITMACNEDDDDGDGGGTP